MLGGVDRLAGKLLAGTDLGQATIFLVFRIVVLLVGVCGDETVEPNDRTDGTQLRGARSIDRLDLGGGALDFGRLHLAGDGALPDQLIEPHLVGIEILPDRCRGAHEIRRADRFVRFLGVLGFGRILARLFRQVFRTEFLGNGIACGVDCLGCHLHAVGSHIGDQTGGLAADLHAFIEALRHLHGAAGREAETRRGGLLQRRGGEGRAGIALGRLGFYRHRLEGCAFEHRLDVVGLRLVGNVELLQLLAIEGGQPRFEILVARRAQQCSDLPVFLADEALDLGFAVADETQRNRANAGEAVA